MYSRKIADIFDEIADILEFKQDNPFKIRAYRRASQLLRSMAEDIEKYASEDTLKTLPGIGAELAAKIKEVIRTGKLNAHERLKREVPAGVLEIMSIPGIGPKKAKLFYDELKIDSVKKLKREAERGTLSALPHVKKKTEENILKSIGFLEEAAKRTPLAEALPFAEAVVENLKRLEEVDKIGIAGSLRRMKDTIRDVDILIASKSPEKVIGFFVKLPMVNKVLAAGKTKSSVVMDNGIQVDVRVVEPACYGAALLYFTGSKAHNISIRQIAVKKGLKINEYGVFGVRTHKLLAGKTEQQVYNSIGMEFIPAEMREDTGEIELAMAGRIPLLVEAGDIKGDLHVHSNLSDGTEGIEEIARICLGLGYEYVAITDHSQSLKVAGGLSEKKLAHKIEKIRKYNKTLKGFKILAGAEVDIKSDGSLDYPDALLQELDVVIAAIHSGFKQTKEKITSRILTAMDSPYVNIIAHPTGRLLGIREAYEVDLEKVLVSAKDKGVAVEINAFSDRLDLNAIHTKQAVEIGTKLVISTDAHNKAHLSFMCLGVAVARRGWAKKTDILNTLSARELLEALRR